MTRNILFVAVITALVFGSLSCGITAGEQAGTGIAGTYISEENPNDFLELKADGTFYMEEMGIGFSGEWEVEGDEITLRLPIGLAVRGQIDGNAIIDPDGERWIKQ